MVRFRVYRPGPFRSGAFLAEARRVNQIHAARIRRDFKKTTRTWQHQPVFRQRTRANVREVSLEVSTDDLIYTWVNDGTKPHIIEARNRPNLAFRETYNAATTPWQIDSQAISESGSLVFPSLVRHPGIEARHFDRAIALRRGPDYHYEMARAFQRGAILSDHDMGSGPGGPLTPPGGGSPPRPAGARRIFSTASTIALGAAAVSTFPGG